MTMTERHHPFCNFFMNARDGCKMCADFDRRYPLKDGERAIDVIDRYFPNAIVIPDGECASDSKEPNNG